MESLGENGTASTSVRVDGSKSQEGSSELTLSKGSEEGNTEIANHSKAQKHQDKSKSEKNSNPKRVGATWVKKIKDGKNSEETSAALNGSHTPASHSRHSKRSIQGNEGSARSLSAPSSTGKQSQQSGKSGSASSTMNKSESEGPKERTGHTKSLRQSSGSKVGENKKTASTNPTPESGLQKKGSLPSYGFNFKCDERAEKRKAFYSKLEEKTQAKEVEKNTLQAKSQESQDAEIKLLRKNLSFKATPMPSFYQEPAPPKVELKKIPPTRAKSPKLGRRKSGPPMNCEGDIDSNASSRRLSLGEEVPQNNTIAKVSCTQNTNKPQQKKSPAKPPPEKPTLANPTEDATPTPMPENQEGLTTEPSTSEPKPDIIAALCEDQAQPSLEQEKPLSNPMSSDQHPPEQH